MVKVGVKKPKQANRQLHLAQGVTKGCFSKVRVKRINVETNNNINHDWTMTFMTFPIFTKKHVKSAYDSVRDASIPSLPAAGLDKADRLALISGLDRHRGCRRCRWCRCLSSIFFLSRIILTMLLLTLGQNKSHIHSKSQL